jgi:delta-aminolevulinic acid dehydratase/porphobilinogen synthase
MSLEKKIKAEVDKRVSEAVQIMASKYISDLKAFYGSFENALKAEGYGKKRLERIIKRINEEVPEHLQIMEVENK